jgi:transcription antitermination protein NusB
VSSGRRSARRQAAFILYQQDLLELTPQAALQRVDDAELDRYARELVLGTAAQLEAIDSLLEQHVAGWRLERLGVLERSILRLATYEMLWEVEVPDAVIIDEAVELAKRFCSVEAGSLVNGILGSLAVSETARVGETSGAARDDQ